MTALDRSLGRTAARTGATLALALALVGLATATRLALSPLLGHRSPFMLYVAAVLAAGLLRGPACGALVMGGGGLAGLRLFLMEDGEVPMGAGLSMMIFWSVSVPVLFAASELRAQFRSAMARLTAALRRGGVA